MRHHLWITWMLLLVLAVGGAEGARLTLEPDDVVMLQPPAGSEELPRLLVSIPVADALEGATIDFARLAVGAEIDPAEGVNESSPLVVDVFAVTTAWTSATVDWEDPWETAGGDFDEQSHMAHVGHVSQNVTVTLDLTHILQAWIDGELENAGVMLVLPEELGHELVGVDTVTEPPVVHVYYTSSEE